MSMTRRITLALPKELWERVERLVPEGERTRLVTEALENEIRRRERLAQIEELRQFQDYMDSKYGELPSSAEEIAAMRRERDDDIMRMR